MRYHTTGRRIWIVGSEQEAKAAGVALTPSVPAKGVHHARCNEFFVRARQPCTYAGGWQFPNPAWWAGLPRDARQLYERLQRDAPDNGRGDVEALVYASDALRTGLLPADVRAPLYRALALIPGLEMTDGAANLDGRIGVAYAMDDGTVRQEVIIDPKTGQLIGERQVLTRESDGAPAGSMISFSSTTTSIVDDAPER